MRKSRKGSKSDSKKGSQGKSLRESRGYPESVKVSGKRRRESSSSEDEDDENEADSGFIVPDEEVDGVEVSHSVHPVSTHDSEDDEWEFSMRSTRPKKQRFYSRDSDVVILSD